MTPVRTGPSPTFSGPSPEINVVNPTSTPHHVGDGVERAGRSVERNTEQSCAPGLVGRLGRGGQAREARTKTHVPHQSRAKIYASTFVSLSGVQKRRVRSSCFAVLKRRGQLSRRCAGPAAAGGSSRPSTGGGFTSGSVMLHAQTQSSPNPVRSGRRGPG